MAGLGTLSKRLEAWVATVGADALVERSTEASDHAFPLRRAQRAAAHQMTEAQEDLAAELSLTGGRAWARLHGEITSRLTVDVPFPGEAEPRTLPMAAVRGLATDPDAGVRRSAFTAELAAWETVEVPLATALNAFKGEANVAEPPARLGGLARRRAAQQQRRPGHARGDAGGGRRLARRLRPLQPGQGHAARPPVGRAAVVGHARPGRLRPALRVVGGHRRGGRGVRHLRAGSGRPGRAGRSTTAGSTPSPAPARSAAPSACRSRAR